jgi:hypothetical protein
MPASQGTRLRELWPNSVGLKADQVEVHTGWLNRVARRWTTEGFNATIRAVCEDCNHGWASQLERAGKPVLTPLTSASPLSYPSTTSA